MPSSSASKYAVAIARAQTLRQAATDRRLRPKSQDEIQIYYHASLAVCVAAWDAYINNLVREFYGAIANPLDVRFHAVYSVAQQAAEQRLERFNTPNWENTRNLLAQSTGYDPINDWVWKRRRMGVTQVRERLNEILKVRHSFAHGFSLPAYNWNQSPTGRTRLTSKTLRDVEAFFNNLVHATDKGLKQHINQTYGLAIPW